MKNLDELGSGQAAACCFLKAEKRFLSADQIQSGYLRADQIKTRDFRADQVETCYLCANQIEAGDVVSQLICRFVGSGRETHCAFHD